MTLLRTMAPTSQEGSEELAAKLEIMEEYTKRLEDEISQLRVLLEQQQQRFQCNWIRRE